MRQAPNTGHNMRRVRHGITKAEELRAAIVKQSWAVAPSRVRRTGCARSKNALPHIKDAHRRRADFSKQLTAE